MRILHVLNVPFVIPFMLGDQIKYMNSNGCEIHIACSYGSKIEEYKKKWNFLYTNININRSISPLDDIISVYKIYKYIKHNNIDIVVGHTPKGGFISMLAAYLSKIEKRIYFRHGLLSDTTKGVKKHLFLNVERLSSYFSTTTICVSNSIFKKSLKLNLSKKSKLKIFNKGTCNGIDANNEYNRGLISNEQRLNILLKYNIHNSDIIVGYIGRLSKDKGINELIDAWKIIIKKNSNIKLMLCGPVDDRDPISMDLYNYIKNESSIIFCGEVKSPKLYYSIFSFFILPSYREGFPTVVLEASSMNLAVITTRSTGCIDSIIENQTGIFTDINPTSISKSIQYYINYPNIAILHGQNGRKFVLDNFQQNSIWEEILKSYKVD